MAETETATFMTRLMTNIDVAAVGAVAGFIASKMMGRNKRNQMGF
jgi:uncharacterized membrane protein YeaQ/YmgE (transglycosylase-associated protein family)